MAKEQKHMTSIGGQAVIEGVMMRGPLGVAVAVRKPDGEIVVDKSLSAPKAQTNKLLKLPIIRGVVNFISSMVLGVKALTFSADFVDIEEDDPDYKPSKFETFLQNKFGDKTKDIVIYFSVFLALIMGIGLFILLPTFIASFLTKFQMPDMLKTLIEGVIRILIFMIYIIAVSQMKDIKRVFEYHGAEHKTIFAYENGEELTPENVRKYSRLHPRCGTNFLLIVMIVSIIIFSFLSWSNVWLRMLSRLALLPVVAGVSYEIIKFAGRHQTGLCAILCKPGLWLQLLTTREPDDSQLEVAIAALLNVKTENKEDDKW